MNLANMCFWKNNGRLTMRHSLGLKKRVEKKQENAWTTPLNDIIASGNKYCYRFFSPFSCHKYFFSKYKNQKAADIIIDKREKKEVKRHTSQNTFCDNKQFICVCYPSLQKEK